MQIEGHQTHTRVHDSVLADLEKRSLVWMARRMPSWVNSDHLTLIGALSMLLAGVSYWVASWNRWALLLVVVALGLNWFGDSLDGTLARVRDRQRPRYGWYVDHVTDMVGTAFLLGGLAISDYMSPVVALGLLAAFTIVEAEVFLATHIQGVFRLAFLKLSPTELRFMLAMGTLYLLHQSWVRINGLGYFRLFDVGGVIAIAGLILAFITSAIRNARSLYDAERVSL